MKPPEEAHISQLIVIKISMDTFSQLSKYVKSHEWAHISQLTAIKIGSHLNGHTVHSHQSR